LDSELVGRLIGWLNGNDENRRGESVLDSPRRLCLVLLRRMTLD